MIDALAASAVYVRLEPTDLRKSIDGLALLVEGAYAASAVSGALFVFFNRGRDKVKLLVYDRHGFWLCYKRLERGRFALPRTSLLTAADLRLLLEGIDLSVRRLRPVAVQRIA